LAALASVGLVKSESLAKGRKIAALVIAALSGIITPDASGMTMLILALPLYLLYELSIVVVRFKEKKKLSALLPENTLGEGR